MILICSDLYLSFFFLALPCYSVYEQDASLIKCFKIGLIALVLLIYNGILTVIMFINFKRLVQINKINQSECQRLLTDHFQTKDLNTIRFGATNTIASELKNELTTAEFAEAFKRIGALEVSVGSVRTIASDEPSPFPRPTVY